MNGLVYAKTIAGLQEMQLRQAQLHPRARSLLILIDGKQCVRDLCGKFATPALVQEYLKVLQEKGLVQVLDAAVASRQASPLPAQPLASVAPPATPLSELQSLAPAGRAERIAALISILNSTILQCFMLQPEPYLEKLGRTRRIRDFVALGNEIIVSLNKAGRSDQAAEFKQRVKPLLS